MSTPLSYVRRTPYIARYYYPADYFSGCDVRLYANGVLIDEASQIAFVLNEAVYPIYGYASAAFDGVARGTRIVQGWFDVNFRKPEYLRELLGQMPSVSSDAVSRVLSEVGYPSTPDDDGLDFVEWAKSYQDRFWGVSEFERHPTLGVGGFDIVITYGPQKSPSRREKGADSSLTVPNAVNTINTVYLVGMAKTIDHSGNPIVERYNFLARDINKPVKRS